MAVADDDDGLCAPHHSDGLGNLDLRGLVEHHKVELDGTRREEPCDRIRAHEEARRKMREDLPVSLDQLSDAEAARNLAQLPLERAIIAYACSRGERPLLDEAPWDHISHQFSLPARTVNVGLDATVLCQAIKLIDSSCLESLA